ncbi:aspartate/glutamate racemase family protein [Paradevosia shaoguanensis]|uniref:aspartate/glutamate racemase family protein n=1 Tax=Paradevosia shaoguanensis TaxID=1335043 RepID=UPI003C7829A3
MARSRTIGLLGGMSWESTALYYRLLNTGMQRELGGHHNARSLLLTLDYDDLDTMASAGDWDGIAAALIDAARRVEGGGADFLVITAITGHAVAEGVEAALSIPLLHAADVAGEKLRVEGYRRVGLLGTRFTMSMDFFTARLRGRHGLEILVPEENDREAIHRIIIDELTLGRVEPASQASVLEIAARLQAAGAEALLLACTELPLLLPTERYSLPTYDVVKLHAEAAIAWAIR